MIMLNNESDFIKTVGVIEPYIEGVIEENYRIRARNDKLEAEKVELTASIDSVIVAELRVLLKEMTLTNLQRSIEWAEMATQRENLLHALIECSRYGSGETTCQESYLPPSVRDTARAAIDKATGSST
jgi:hypothetical protein